MNDSNRWTQSFYIVTQQRFMNRRQEKSVSDSYDERYRDGYRESFAAYERARQYAIKKAMSPLRDKFKMSAKPIRIMEYGAGQGLYVPFWKELFPEADLHCCDISCEGLTRLAIRFPELAGKTHPVVGNRCKCESDVFDAVFSVEVMEHVEDLNAYLQDVYRILRPSGVFAWTTPCANRFSMERIYSRLTGRIESAPAGGIRWNWEETMHLRRLKGIEAKKALAQVGFKRVRLRYRAHLFSFLCTAPVPSWWVRSRNKFIGPMTRMRLMMLEYDLFRRFPNGASMLGFACKPLHESQ